MNLYNLYCLSQNLTDVPQLSRTFHDSLAFPVYFDCLFLRNDLQWNHCNCPNRRVSRAALSGLQWRDVGPMRGGRSFAVAGVPSQPNTFYMGSVGGGVWKTENAGRTWLPIADQGIPIGSIGAIAVAPSDPNVVYVGTGEPDIRNQHSYGIGMYKSVDAGKTWTHIGLDDSGILGGSWSTQRTRIACTWPCWGISTTRTWSAACIARPMAAPIGRRCC